MFGIHSARILVVSVESILSSRQNGATFLGLPHVFLFLELRCGMNQWTKKIGIEDYNCWDNFSGIIHIDCCDVR